jgi:methyl-accepting chemotaxis protein
MFFVCDRCEFRKLKGEIASNTDENRGNVAASEEVAASAKQQLAAIEEISVSAQSLTQMAEELRLVIFQSGL